MIQKDVVQIIGFILGGLAIFIYGIEMMSDALKSIAGTRIREYIEKYTRNLLMSILVGTIISALLHSSSAVTVISISLVRAGLMGLEQAIGITIGANIGTCITSIMIGLDIEQFAYYFVFIGVTVMFLAKRKKISYVGKVLAGFGLIFVGLEMMSTQLTFMAQEQWFINIMVFLGKYPWLALLGATIATAIMQSSTAIIGIVQKLYVTGVLTPAAGAAFIFGANVGTCMTALLAALGGSIATKRAAWFHVVYNALGAFIGMIFLTPFIALINSVNQMIGGGGEMYIAQAHFMFNLISTILVIPFVGQCVRLLKLLIPGEDSQGIKVENIDELDDHLIEKFPAGALAVAKKNTLRMGRNVKQIIRLSKEYLETKDNEIYDEVLEVEALVNKYDTLLSEYLLKIAQQPTLAHDQTKEYYKNYQIIKYLEQISDQVKHLVDFYKMVYEEKGEFTQETIVDLKNMYQQLELLLDDAINIYDKKHDTNSLAQFNQKGKELNQCYLDCQQNHFDRMCENIYDHTIASSVILDILSTMERIADLSIEITNRTFVAYKLHEDKYLQPEKI
ncbi:MAG: Na/Pi cotransporter family protein [Faecalibacillus sp.]